MQNGLRSFSFTLTVFATSALVFLSFAGCEPAAEQSNTSGSGSTTATSSAESTEKKAAGQGGNAKGAKRKKISAMNDPNENDTGPTRNFGN